MTPLQLLGAACLLLAAALALLLLPQPPPPPRVTTAEYRWRRNRAIAVGVRLCGKVRCGRLAMEHGELCSTHYHELHQQLVDKLREPG